MDEIRSSGTERPAAILIFPKKPFRALPLDALPGGAYARQCIELQNIAHTEEIERLYRRIKGRRLNTTMLLLLAALAATSCAAAVVTLLVQFRAVQF